VFNLTLHCWNIHSTPLCSQKQTKNFSVIKAALGYARIQNVFLAEMECLENHIIAALPRTQKANYTNGKAKLSWTLCRKTFSTKACGKYLRFENNILIDWHYSILAM